MRLLRNEMNIALKRGVMLAFAILAIWTADAAASTAPSRARCLFDLSIEELMEIRIDAADWSWGCPAGSGETPFQRPMDDPGLDGPGDSNRPALHSETGHVSRVSYLRPGPAFTRNR